MNQDAKPEIPMHGNLTDAATTSSSAQNSDALPALIAAETAENRAARVEFYTAFAAAQAAPPKIEKTQSASFGAKGGKVGFAYEDLAQVIQIVLPWLGKHGLSVRWDIHQEPDDYLGVECYLTHRGGHSETCRIMAATDGSGGMNSVQKIGSTITYLRRYSLLAITGLAAEKEDDDGHAAGTPDVRKINAGQADKILELISRTGRNEKKFCEFFGIASVYELPAGRLSEAQRLLAAAASKKRKDDAALAQLENAPENENQAQEGNGDE